MPKKTLMNEPVAAAIVTVTSGMLAGMPFEVEDHTPVIQGKMKVKYKAPDNGPRVIVEHIKVAGVFREADKAEDVRIAFSKLLAVNIRWSAERGYSDKTSGNPLRWDRSVARFVPVSTTTEK